MAADATRSVIPLPPGLVQVPDVKQETDFSCGAAAALSLLRFWRHDAYVRVHEAELYASLRTSQDDGTEPEPIVAYLRSAAGLDAVYRHGDVTLAQLERAVLAGEPPLVDLQAWREDSRPWAETWDAGHYVILVGCDRENLFFMDPSVLTPGSHAWLPRAELDERWHDVSGPTGERLHRMTVFARGDGPRWTPRAAPPTTATRMR